MQVEITQTTPIYRHPADHGVFVQWVVHDPPLTEIKFKLERSGAPEGPWEPVVSNIEAYHFFDVSRRPPPPPGPGEDVVDLNYLSLTRTVYYRLTGVSKDGAADTDVSDVGGTLPRFQVLMKQKMQRDLAITFKFNGVDVAVLKRRHWGQRCSVCFDRLTRKVTNSKCTVCFGTGFHGGYFAPVRIMGRFLAPNSETQLVPQGKSDTTQIRFICGQQPTVDPDDILVEIAQNRRFIVVAQNETQLRRETVHQSIIASELARDSVEYRIPANWDHHPVMY